MLDRSLQPDVVRIRHAERLDEARELRATAQLKRHAGVAPLENPFARLQTILSAAGHSLPSQVALATSLRAAGNAA